MSQHKDIFPELHDARRREAFCLQNCIESMVRLWIPNRDGSSILAGAFWCLRSQNRSLPLYRLSLPAITSWVGFIGDHVMNVRKGLEVEAIDAGIYECYCWKGDGAGACSLKLWIDLFYFRFHTTTYPNHIHKQPIKLTKIISRCNVSINRRMPR